MASERVNPCPIGKTKKSRNSCNIDDSKVKASVGNEQISDSKSKSDRGSCVRSKSARHGTRRSRDSSEGKIFSWGKIPRYRRFWEHSGSFMIIRWPLANLLINYIILRCHKTVYISSTFMNS